MANESAKGSKAGRIRDSDAHKRYNSMDVARQNKMRRELKNLRQNPDDIGCFNRLKSYLNTPFGIPVGSIKGTPLYETTRKAYDGFIATHGCNA